MIDTDKTPAIARAAALATLAQDIGRGQTGDAPSALVGDILADLAVYVGETAGDLDYKAVDEIAYAYLAGARDAVERSDARQNVSRARRLVAPILDAINR